MTEKRSVGRQIEDRLNLINHVWQWDEAAVERNAPAEIRNNIWRVLDALYDDLPIVRKPGYRARLKGFLDGMNQTKTVIAVKGELGL